MYLKQRLAAGQRLIGADISCPNPDAIDLLAGRPHIWYAHLNAKVTD